MDIPSLKTGQQFYTGITMIPLLIIVAYTRCFGACVHFFSCLAFAFPSPVGTGGMP